MWMPHIPCLSIGVSSLEHDIIRSHFIRVMLKDNSSTASSRILSESAHGHGTHSPDGGLPENCGIRSIIAVESFQEIQRKVTGQELDCMPVIHI